MEYEPPEGVLSILWRDGQKVQGTAAHSFQTAPSSASELTDFDRTRHKTQRQSFPSMKIFREDMEMKMMA